jgi:predicted RNase H-like nuclease
MLGMSTVLGVDGCRGAWVGIVLDDDGHVDGVHAVRIADLVGRARALAPGGLAAVGIDIPIGLPDIGRRRADTLARALLGPRSSSIFPVPVRSAVEEAEHAVATARNVELAGVGISRQSHGLRTAILDVDGWLRSGGAGASPVVEVHPELAFATLAGRPPAQGKKTWSGMEMRRRLLADAGIEIPAELGVAGAVAAPDDVLDAAVVAWTARRVVAGTAVSYPDPPERFSDGLDAAIRA